MCCDENAPISQFAALLDRGARLNIHDEVVHSTIFLSFECSELEGKYSLIVSVYACMHYVWEVVVGCHSGDAGLFVYVACMDGLAQLVGI